MSYTLITDNDGYGEVFYMTPCGMKIRMAQVYFDIFNDQGRRETPSLIWEEKQMSVKMVEEVMKLINTIEQKEIHCG